MNGTYQLVVPDGGKADAYIANIENAVIAARRQGGELNFDLLDYRRDGTTIPAQFSMLKVQNSERTVDGLLVFEGYGTVRTESEDIDPVRDCRRMRCAISRPGVSIKVETLKDKA